MQFFISVSIIWKKIEATENENALGERVGMESVKCVPGQNYHARNGLVHAALPVFTVNYRHFLF
ncbi:MAG: hypothetical protein HKN53_09395 [Maribacter sp.]|nr:hypothetical protein [Maribacter sp.]